MNSGPTIGIVLGKKTHDISYSTRRRCVDEFFFRNISKFQLGSKILDMGGKRERKRGVFDVSKYELKVEYANSDKTVAPDYLCDIADIPVLNDFYDGIICAETLEHVKDPEIVLKEAYRILKPHGILLISVPFLFQIHADPYDYGRYTDYYWKNALNETGFVIDEIETQGLYFSVLANMLKLFAYDMYKDGKPNNRLIRFLIRKIVCWLEEKAIRLDKKPSVSNHPFFRRYTTGYGIVARKYNNG